MKRVVCAGGLGLGLRADPLAFGLVAGQPGGGGQRRGDRSCPRWTPGPAHVRRRCRRWASRCFSSSRPTPSIPAISFSRTSCLLSLSRPGVGGDRLAARRRELPVRAHPVDQRVAGSTPGRRSPRHADAPGSPATIRQKMRCSRPRRLKARISSFTQRDFAAAGEQMTIWNADCSQRPRQRLAEIGRGRQLVAVPEHGRESRRERDRTAVSLADEVLRHAVSLEAPVQPLGPLLVAVAVADEGAVLELGIHSSRST